MASSARALSKKKRRALPVHERGAAATMASMLRSLDWPLLHEEMMVPLLAPRGSEAYIMAELERDTLFGCPSYVAAIVVELLGKLQQLQLLNTATTVVNAGCGSSAAIVTTEFQKHASIQYVHHFDVIDVPAILDMAGLIFDVGNTEDMREIMRKVDERETAAAHHQAGAGKLEMLASGAEAQGRGKRLLLFENAVQRNEGLDGRAVSCLPALMEGDIVAIVQRVELPQQEIAWRQVYALVKGGGFRVAHLGAKEAFRSFPDIRHTFAVLVRDSSVNGTLLSPAPPKAIPTKSLTCGAVYVFMPSYHIKRDGTIVLEGYCGSTVGIGTLNEVVDKRFNSHGSSYLTNGTHPSWRVGFAIARRVKEENFDPLRVFKLRRGWQEVKELKGKQPGTKSICQPGTFGGSPKVFEVKVVRYRGEGQSDAAFIFEVRKEEQKGIDELKLQDSRALLNALDRAGFGDFEYFRAGGVVRAETEGIERILVKAEQASGNYDALYDMLPVRVRNALVVWGGDENLQGVEGELSLASSIAYAAPEEGEAEEGLVGAEEEQVDGEKEATVEDDEATGDELVRLLQEEQVEEQGADRRERVRRMQAAVKVLHRLRPGNIEESLAKALRFMGSIHMHFYFVETAKSVGIPPLDLQLARVKAYTPVYLLPSKEVLLERAAAARGRGAATQAANDRNTASNDLRAENNLTIRTKAGGNKGGGANHKGGEGSKMHPVLYLSLLPTEDHLLKVWMLACAEARKCAVAEDLDWPTSARASLRLHATQFLKIGANATGTISWTHGFWFSYVSASFKTIFKKLNPSTASTVITLGKLIGSLTCKGLFLAHIRLDPGQAPSFLIVEDTTGKMTSSAVQPRYQKGVIVYRDYAYWKAQGGHVVPELENGGGGVILTKEEWEGLEKEEHRPAAWKTAPENSGGTRNSMREANTSALGSLMPALDVQLDVLLAQANFRQVMEATEATAGAAAEEEDEGEDRDEVGTKRKKPSAGRLKRKPSQAGAAASSSSSVSRSRLTQAVDSEDEDDEEDEEEDFDDCGGEMVLGGGGGGRLERKPSQAGAATSSSSSASRSRLTHGVDSEDEDDEEDWEEDFDDCGGGMMFGGSGGEWRKASQAQAAASSLSSGGGHGKRQAVIEQKATLPPSLPPPSPPPSSRSGHRLKHRQGREEEEEEEEEEDDF